MGMFNTKSSLRQLHQLSYQLFTSEHQQLLVCVQRGREGQEWLWEVALGDLAIVNFNFETARNHIHTHTHISGFTRTVWIDSCLSLSTHLIFSPSNPAPRSPVLFLDSSFLLTADNTGVLLVCIPVKVPNWLMQWTATVPKHRTFYAIMLQIPMGISARQRWGAVLASLGGKACWGFSLKRLTSEIQFLAALYNWVCWWHYVESACYLPTHL